MGFIYQIVYFVFILLFILLTRVSLTNVKTYHTTMGAFLVALIFCVFITFRPPVDYTLGDVAYGYHYLNTVINSVKSFDFETEWLWVNIQVICQSLQFTYQVWFGIIAAGYIGGMYIFCVKHFNNNVLIGFLFFLTAFSFFPYAFNGIRNGLACSLIIWGFAYLLNNKKKYVFISMILFYMAYSCHKSTILPIGIALLLHFRNISIKNAIRFWVISIFLSFLFGEAITSFFVDLGFDDRLERYTSESYKEDFSSEFSSTGFRWDFIIYSSVPIIFAWYISVKRQLVDYKFELLANTYILCNAFWVMLINSTFSNRFAYLSWFMYPILLAYPLLNMKIWRRQEQKTKNYLWLHSGFTFMMWIRTIL